MASIFDDLIPKTTTSTTKPKTGYTGTMFADLIPDKKQTKKELLSSSFDYKSAEDIQNMSFSEKEAYKSKLSKDIGSFMPFSSSKQAIPTQSRPIQEDLEQLSPVQQEQYKTKYRTLLDEEMKKTTYTERLATAVPNYFLAEKFQDTKSPIIRALNFDEIQMLTPQERTQYKELLKKDIFDGLADTTLTPENKKVLQTEEGTKEFSLGNPLKLSLELTAMMYGVKTPKAVKDFLNTPIGKEAMLSVAENTENLPIKLLAKFQEQTKIPIMGNVNVGAEYEKILNAWVEAGTNPDAPAWKRFLYTAQSTLPQTALGVLLNVSGNYILPGAGNALSGAYWMALSGSDQIQRRGKIYSVTNLGIDVALDSFLGNSIEGIFKKGAKDILIKEMGKNGVIEGGTEVSQTLLKYANDWASAPNERAKKEVLAQAVNYVKSGDMFMEFASSFASGAIIGGAGNVVDAKIRPQAKINVKTDMGQIPPPGQTEMAQETIETPQQVETPVKAETTPLEVKTTPEKDSPQDLMEEARKYKSAEEFVKAQGKLNNEYVNIKQSKEIKLYRGGTSSDQLFVGKRGAAAGQNVPALYFTDSPDVANLYKTMELAKGKTDASVMNKSFNPELFKKVEYMEATPYLIGQKKLEDKYIGIVHPEVNIVNGKEVTSNTFIQLKNKSQKILGEEKPLQIKTKSQLIDIWNKAQEKPTDLIQEAKKYKTAEEFVKAQPKYKLGLDDERNYREAIKNYRDGFYPNPEVDFFDKPGHFEYGNPLPDKTYKWLDSYTRGTVKNAPSSIIQDDLTWFIPKEPVVLYRGIPATGDSVSNVGFRSWTYDKKVAESFAGKDGRVIMQVIEPKDILFDSTKAPTAIWSDLMNPEEMEVIVKNIKTKSQLTDIWNKAQEQQVEKPKGKETKLGKSIALKAIEDKLIKTYEGVAEYTPTTIEKQAKMSNDLLQNDMEGVRQIFRGQRDLPKGLNPSALVVATETFLKENKIADAPQILAEMMNSNLVSESSVAGQTLRLLAEREQDSATAKLQEIKKHREEKAKKATKKTVASVANDASLFMSQDNLNQLEKNLDSFLDSITC